MSAYLVAIIFIVVLIVSAVVTVEYQQRKVMQEES